METLATEEAGPAIYVVLKGTIEVLSEKEPTLLLSLVDLILQKTFPSCCERWTNASFIKAADTS